MGVQGPRYSQPLQRIEHIAMPRPELWRLDVESILSELFSFHVAPLQEEGFGELALGQQRIRILSPVRADLGRQDLTLHPLRFLQLTLATQPSSQIQFAHQSARMIWSEGARENRQRLPLQIERFWRMPFIGKDARNIVNSHGCV